MPRSGWVREPWPLSLRVQSLCSATGEATAVRGLRTAKKPLQYYILVKAFSSPLPARLEVLGPWMRGECVCFFTVYFSSLY